MTAPHSIVFQRLRAVCTALASWVVVSSVFSTAATAGEVLVITDSGHPLLDWALIAARISNPPAAEHPSRAQFEREVSELMRALADSDDFHPGERIAALHAQIRQHIRFMAADRAMDGDVRTITRLVAERALSA